ncbi:hypothetical protein MMC20_001901 [Loxospora ochrophaea]|nr:hypothetical protein [Loxospora ochrophaea]
MSLWHSYRSLSPRTRLLLGLGTLTWAGIGLALTEPMERRFGLVPTEEDRERLPRIVTVDRGSDDGR